ncbi:MAG: YigZ family protein [Bacteroidota bacterium]
MSDQYTTLKSSAFGEFRDRNSRFLAYGFPVFSEHDIKDKQEKITKLHPKASHHCYAYRLGLSGNAFRANDDGEPSGTAGRPILGQIDSFGLTNVFIVVVRYYGGTKLGTSGLINAYKSAAKIALTDASTIEKTLDDIFLLTFKYDIMPHVMQFVKDQKLEIVEQSFEDIAMLKIGIRKTEAEFFLNELKKLGVVDINFLFTR